MLLEHLRDGILRLWVPREISEIGLVRAQRRHGARDSRFIDRDEMRGVAPGEQEPGGSPGGEIFVAQELGEDPTIVRVTHGIDCGDSGRTVIRVVDAPRNHERTGAADDGIRSECTNLPGDGSAQIEAHLEGAIRKIEDRQPFDANRVAGPSLLVGTQRTGLFGRSLHAGLAGGEEQIRNLDPRGGPLSNRGGRAVFGVVWVGDHHEDTFDASGIEGVQCWANRFAHASYPTPITSGLDSAILA